MTSQRSPNRDPLRHTRMRRENGTFNIWPVLLGLVFLAVLGFMLFGPDRDTTAPSQQTRIEQTNPTNAPGTTKTPTSAPPATTPPKQ